eukprot:689585-Prorocentrum_minimum.AAC.1
MHQDTLEKLQEKILKYPTLPMPYFWRGLYRMKMVRPPPLHPLCTPSLDKSKEPVRCTRSLLLRILDVHNVGN